MSETWYSAELTMTLLAKSSDPRSGDTEKRVISLTRAEPDPSLFQVPPNYTVNGE
jgi:hypothetical protein